MEQDTHTEAGMPGFIPFKELAEQVDITEVARHLGLKLRPSSGELRGQCPTCQSGDHRALCVYPETNSFRCFAAEQSGDCIGLYSHIKEVGMYPAAKALKELFSPSLSGTVPSKSVEKKAEPRKVEPPAFDPQKFAERLTWGDAVAQLGLTKDEAAHLGVGYHTGRKGVFFPIRHADGSISAFIGIKDGKLVMPPQWLPPSGNVVKLRRA